MRIATVMTRACVVAVILVLAPYWVCAQDTPAVQVSFGYTNLAQPNAILVQARANELSPFFTRDADAPASGWFVEAVGKVTDYAGIVGQVSSNYTTARWSFAPWRGNHTAYTLLSGPRVSAPCCRRIVPFAEGLIGLVHSQENLQTKKTQVGDTVVAASTISRSSDNYFALTGGGGADIRLGRSVGFHLATDGMRTSRQSGNLSGNKREWTWRLHIGLTLPMRW